MLLIPYFNIVIKAQPVILIAVVREVVVVVEVVVGDAAQFGPKIKRTYPKVETIRIDKLNLGSATLK